MRTSLYSLILLVASLPLAGCRTPGDPKGGALKTYEQPEYAGKDICDLLRTEAKAKAPADGEAAFQAYRQAFSREKGIFDTLVAKAKDCAAPGANEAKTPDPSAAAVADGDAPAVSAAAVDTEAPVQCDGLTVPGRLADLNTKLVALHGCDPETASGEQMVRAVLSGAQPAEPDPAVGSKLVGFCDEVGLDPEYCRNGVRKGVKFAREHLDRICAGTASLLTTHPSGSVSEEAFKSCNADVIQDVCGRYVAAVVSTAAAGDADARALEQKLQDASLQFASDNAEAFVAAEQKCFEPYLKEELVKLFAAEATKLGVTAFGRGILQAQTWLDDARVRAVVGKACEIATERSATTIGQYDQTTVTRGCGDVLVFDKQRIAACLQTTKDFACDAIAGKIDLASTLKLGDKQQMARTWADLGSRVLQAGCSAGGSASSLSCSLIDQSTRYITDAFAGKSNPWADCAGTPAAAVCLNKKWREYSTGVLDTDYAVGRAESHLVAAAQKYENQVCWCWRRCQSSDWGADREIYKGLWYYTAEKGAAGERFCAAQNHKIAWPNGMTYGGGRSKVYVKWDGCEVATARGDTPELQTKDGKIDIYYQGKWQRFQMSEPGECGGRTDQGI